jgi:hypothetical protein
MVSNRVGCVAPHSIAELNGRLYFMHHAGVYEFDGSQIRDIGRPVFQSFLAEAGWVTIPGKGGGVGMPPVATTSGLAVTQAVVDDLDSVVWFAAYGTSGGTTYATLYGYNQISQKWGRLSSVSATATASVAPLVQATYADITAFGPVDMSFNEARFFIIPQGSLYYIRYPIASSNVALTTGVLGSVERSDGTVRVWPRTLVGSSSAPFAGGTLAGFTDEAGNLTNGTATLTANSEFDSLDGKLAAKYRTVSLVGGTSKIAIIAGLDVEGAGNPTRR